MRQWPVDEVKVDRAFVRSMVVEPRDRAIVKATIDLAHTLGLEVVAEGVENEPILSMLTAFGCERAQGFLIARSMPARELARWCDARGDSVTPALLAA